MNVSTIRLLRKIEAVQTTIEAHLVDSLSAPDQSSLFTNDDIGAFQRGKRRGEASAAAAIRNRIGMIREIAEGDPEAIEVKILNSPESLSMVTILMLEVTSQIAAPPALPPSCLTDTVDYQMGVAGESAGVASVTARVLEAIERIQTEDQDPDLAGLDPNANSDNTFHANEYRMAMAVHGYTTSREKN